MEQTDFPVADGFSPIDPPVFLGLDPTLLVALVLLMLAVAAGMYLLGRRRTDGSGSDAERAADEIHDAILKASTAAMSAGSDELKSRAQTLKSVVEECLGPVLVLGKGVGKPMDMLTDALKGETTRKHDAHHDPHTPSVHAPAHGATPTPVTINQIYVGGAPAEPDSHGGHGDHPGHDHRPGHGHDAHKSDARDMTAAEQIDALGRAVRAFHDHWSRRGERVRELTQARQALSRRPRAGLLGSSGERRVWDRS